MPLPMLFGGGGAAPLYQMTNSLLFRGAQVVYRSVTTSATVGLSVWVRRGKLGAVSPILGSSLKFNANDTMTAWTLTTTAVYRDPTAWMHIAIAAGHLYVNGVDMGAVTTSAVTISSTNGLGYDGTNYFHGYMAEPALFNGSQPTLSACGVVDATTLSWVPRAISGATDYLGKPWNSASLGTDYSGNGNTWTASGFSASDVVTDTPTNVFATLNPIDRTGTTVTFSEGNTKATRGTGAYCIVRSTLQAPSTNLYWETTYSADGGGGAFWAGMHKLNSAMVAESVTGYIGYASDSYAVQCVVGIGARKVNNNVITLISAVTVAVNDTIGLCYNPTVQAIWARHNGTWLNSATTAEVEAGNTTHAIWTGVPTDLAPAITANGQTTFFNCGQKAFRDAAPTGFKSLCTTNMPTTTGATSGSFTGNANADGPCVSTGAVPATLTIDGSSVTWGTHADKLATGFKIRTASSPYNDATTNNWTATYSGKPTVGSNHVPANAQGNP